MHRMHSTYTTAHKPLAPASVNGYGNRFRQWPLRTASTLCVVVWGNQVSMLLNICALCEYEYIKGIENRRNSGLRLYKRCAEPKENKSI